MTGTQGEIIGGIVTGDYGPDDGRVQVIHEAISYSRRFSGSWFVVHASHESITPGHVSQDLLLLRSLGINVAVVVPETGRLHQDGLAVDLRKALNRDDLTAVGLTWEETRAADVAWRHQRRWQQIGESGSLIVIVQCGNDSSLRDALTLAVECSAAKLLLLDEDWDPARLPVGGPGAPAPSADVVRPYLAELGSAAAVIAVEAVEAGISEVHIVPTRGKAHPILLEIFTEAGIGTWIGA
jgi:hypothetical protein